MNYHNRIQKSIDFIEENLDCDITLVQIANKAFCSLYHFHRIFQAMVGESVKEYIRKRRLTKAASDLIESGDKIIDIALKYQYKTHESFSRAFCEAFGVTPSGYRKEKNPIHAFTRVNLYENIYTEKLEGVLSEPTIIYKEEMKVVGFKLSTCKENEADFKQIIKLWDRFFTRNLGDKIPNRKYPGTYLGYSCDFDEHLRYSYLACSEVKDFSVIPRGLVSKTIPASRYIAFKVKCPVADRIIDAWRYLYAVWLPNSGYELNDKTDIDVINQSLLFSDSSEMDIYIPIK